MQSSETHATKDFKRNEKTKTYGGKGFIRRKNEKKEGFWKTLANNVSSRWKKESTYESY